MCSALATKGWSGINRRLGTHLNRRFRQVIDFLYSQNRRLMSPHPLLLFLTFLFAGHNPPMTQMITGTIGGTDDGQAGCSTLRVAILRSWFSEYSYYCLEPVRTTPSSRSHFAKPNIRQKHWIGHRIDIFLNSSPHLSIFAVARTTLLAWGFWTARYKKIVLRQKVSFEIVTCIELPYGTLVRIVRWVTLSIKTFIIRFGFLSIKVSMATY